MCVQSKQYYKFEVLSVMSPDSGLVFSTGEAEGCVSMEDAPIEDVLFNDRDTAVNYLENFLEQVDTIYEYGEMMSEWFKPALEKIEYSKWVVGKFEFVVTLVCSDIQVV